MLARPLLFWLALAVAALDLLGFAWLPPRGDGFAALCLGSFAVAGGILFGMLVLVHGGHGFVGRLVGVEKDRNLRFTPLAWPFFLAGTVLLLLGLDRQRDHPEAFALFACGWAILAAGSTQSRRSEDA